MKKTIAGFIWLTVITVLSLLPGKSFPDLSWASLIKLDKLGHFGVYFVLMLLWNYRMDMNRVNWLIAFATYGILLEFAQGMMYAGRRFEVLDIIANIIGLCAGYWIAQRFLN